MYYQVLDSLYTFPSYVVKMLYLGLLFPLGFSLPPEMLPKRAVIAKSVYIYK